MGVCLSGWGACVPAVSRWSPAFRGPGEFNGDYPDGGAEQISYPKRPIPVGSYKPSVFGLYDIHGNVWEWCSDSYDKGYYQNSPKEDPTGPERGANRVKVGGACNDEAWWCRSAYRACTEPGIRGFNFGFRVVVVLKAP